MNHELLTPQSIATILGAMTPLLAIAATIWISTRASRSHKRFDRETEMISKVRDACATYVALTLRLGRHSKTLSDAEERDLMRSSDDYEKVRAAYQYIMMFCTDAGIRDSVEKLSKLDDQRFTIIWKTIDKGEAPISETSSLWERYVEADRKFAAYLPNFYVTIRERIEHHTND